MEGDIRKKGMLYLQQHRFGKKWKRMWCILYRESTCSISRLELLESKDGASTLEKSGRKQESKKVIRLSDCIRVAEVEVDGCPRDCSPFLVETTDKMFVFATESLELQDWTQKLCEIAFPMSWAERGAPLRRSLQQAQACSEEVAMENNSLYSGTDTVMRDFKVAVRRTEAAERCGLRGAYLLRTDFSSLLLKDHKTGEVLFTWPYRFLRRFGRDKVTFSFEAGRRCDSGEGSFEFEAKHGNAIFKAVEAAINLQRQAPRVTEEEDEARTYSTVNEALVLPPGPPHAGPTRSRLEAPPAHGVAPGDKLLTGVKSLTLDTRPPPRKSQVKTFRSCPLAGADDPTYSQITAPAPGPGGGGAGRASSSSSSSSSSSCSAPQDPDYSLPFDIIAKNIMADILQASQPPPPRREEEEEEEREEESRREGGEGREEAPADPLYHSIDDPALRCAGFLGAKPRYAAAAESPTPPPCYPSPSSSSSSSSAPEHIYDEPEGCAMATGGPTSLYDDPEEVKGYAWKVLGSSADPVGHEYPYDPGTDDYAVPKSQKRAFPPGGRGSGEGEEDSPYDNVMMKMM